MSKFAKTITAEKFVCPECAKEFQNLAGLRGHLAYKHKAPTKMEKSTKRRSVGVPPKGATVTPKSSATQSRPRTESLQTPKALPVTRSAPKVPVAAVSNNGAHEHLKTALRELTQRNRQIDEELARMEGLQAEKEIVSKQIDAVSAALQAFGG
jgi:hypothetical protein